MPGSNTPNPPAARIQSCPGCHLRTSSRQSIATERTVRCASQRRAGSTPAASRECQAVNSVTCDARAADARASPSATVIAGGFSTMTCSPAAIARAAMAAR